MPGRQIAYLILKENNVSSEKAEPNAVFLKTLRMILGSGANCNLRELRPTGQGFYRRHHRRRDTRPRFTIVSPTLGSRTDSRSSRYLELSCVGMNLQGRVKSKPVVIDLESRDTKSCTSAMYFRQSSSTSKSYSTLDGMLFEQKTLSLFTTSNTSLE